MKNIKKTRLIGLFLAIVLIFTGIMPAAFAASDKINEENYTTAAPYMLRTESVDEANNEVKLWLELSPSLAESIASFSLSLLVENQNGVTVRDRKASFAFADSLAEAVVKESKFDAEAQVMDLYVAGTKDLVKTAHTETVDSQGNKVVALTNTLELGTIKVEKLADKENRAFKVVLNGRVGGLVTVGIDGSVNDVEETTAADFAIPVDGTVYNVAKEYTLTQSVKGKGVVTFVEVVNNKETVIKGNTLLEDTVVRIGASAQDGYKLESITVTDKNGTAVKIANGDKFVMNGDKTVTVVFSKVEPTTNNNDNTNPNPGNDNPAPTPSCSCMCHKGGFSGAIYKLVRLFWKMFKTNKTCACGVVHY